MKILVISNLFPPIGRGGAEQVASRISHELHSRGHEVTVLTSCGYSGFRSLWPQVTERHVLCVKRWFPLNLYHVLNDWRFPLVFRALWHLLDLCSLHAFFVTWQTIQREEPEVILTHNLKGIGVSTALAIRLSGKRWLHTVHDVQLSIPSGLLLFGQEKRAWPYRVLRRVYETMVQWVLGSSDVVISPSVYLADFYKDRGFFPASHVRVLPNPAPHVKLREQMQTPGRDLRLLFAGQVEAHKGIVFLKKLMDAIDWPIRLSVAGNGSLAAFVEQWADQDPRVCYHGFVSFDNLIPLISLSDGVIVPSLCYENSPTIIYESLLVGTPVIASNVGGVGELLVHEKTGFLCQPADIPSFLQAVEQLKERRDNFASQRHVLRAEADRHRLGHYVTVLETLF